MTSHMWRLIATSSREVHDGRSLLHNILGIQRRFQHVGVCVCVFCISELTLLRLLFIYLSVQIPISPSSSFLIWQANRPSQGCTFFPVWLAYCGVGHSSIRKTFSQFDIKYKQKTLILTYIKLHLNFLYKRSNKRQSIFAPVFLSLLNK